MRLVHLLSIIAAILVITACFFPWIEIESKNIVVSGINEAGTHYGRRGYAHILFTILFLAFHLIPRIWAKRANIFVAALNFAWSFSHLMVFRCEGGECPERQTAFWVIIIGSAFMLAGALLPNTPVSNKSTKD